MVATRLPVANQASVLPLEATCPQRPMTASATLLIVRFSTRHHTDAVVLQPASAIGGLAKSSKEESSGILKRKGKRSVELACRNPLTLVRWILSTSFLCFIQLTTLITVVIHTPIDYCSFDALRSALNAGLTWYHGVTLFLSLFIFFTIVDLGRKFLLSTKWDGFGLGLG